MPKPRRLAKHHTRAAEIYTDTFYSWFESHCAEQLHNGADDSHSTRPAVAWKQQHTRLLMSSNDCPRILVEQLHESSQNPGITSTACVNLAGCLSSVRPGEKVGRRRGSVLDLALLCFAPIISCNCLADRVEARKETVLIACKSLSSIMMTGHGTMTVCIDEVMK